VRQFYLETDPDHLPGPGDIVTLDQAESHHLFTVLRGGRDSQLDLVDGRGLRLTGQPRGQQGKLARVEILTSETDSDEIREPRLILACAVVKGKRFEWALEKAVELGVHEIHPLETDLGVIDPRAGKLERWRSLMIAALKQSRRSWLPTLSEPVTITQALQLHQEGRVYFGATADDFGDADQPTGIGTLLAEDPPRDTVATITLLIGPEGGWSPAERSFMSEHRAQPVSLGPHVLRTETAAVCGLTFLQALRGHWSG
jgi:16S rRNA (uracil1498-N3)-methyltransferase